MRIACIAAMVASCLLVAPASALPIIKLDMKVTSSEVVEGCPSSPCTPTLPAIGSDQPFEISLEQIYLDNGGPVFDGPVLSADVPVWADEFYSPYRAEIVMSHGVPVSGTMQFIGSSDACGLGGKIEFFGRKAIAEFDRCYWLEGPHPFVATRFEGRVVGLFIDGVMVPEPATWALMILGIGAVGCALRRKAIGENSRSATRSSSV